MPIIQLSFTTTRTVTPDALAARAAELAHVHLGKRLDVTAVIIEPVDPSRWFCGGVRLADDSRASFYLDIKVTEGSNTRQEAERFIAETFRAMSELLGPLHPESYVYVREVHAFAYGYGGFTQERRWIDANPRPSASAS